MPTAPTPSANPASIAAPALDLGLNATPTSPTLAPIAEAPAAPEAPAMPEAPSIDPSLLQQAIADVPEEAATTTPDTPSAIPLDNLGTAAPEAPTTSDPSTDFNPLTAAAPAADFSTPTATLTDDAQKTTPSVAFNDPASQPDAPAPHNVQLPSFIANLKNRPVVLIVGGSLIIIIALVLIIAFAI